MLLIPRYAIPSFFSHVFSTCCRIAFKGFALNSGCSMTALNRSISFRNAFPFGRTPTSTFLDFAFRSSAMISSSDDPRDNRFTFNFFGRFRRLVDFLSCISTESAQCLVLCTLQKSIMTSLPFLVFRSLYWRWETLFSRTVQSVRRLKLCSTCSC